MIISVFTFDIFSLIKIDKVSKTNVQSYYYNQNQKLIQKIYFNNIKSTVLKRKIKKIIVEIESRLLTKKT